ncbi:SCP2 sterol-binding domain-containing protein [Hoeflea sp. BAL378]|uniref:ubiquinone anaerobic biosynthesis accessory factor UbiT n=1 Tax=Hoeflea sp. BAL378 TaxID=1547437 RepID=UPI00191C630B|nr:SCP2 sterol-binding domain-containing protein [Hoeflea sp. BAL378]
MSFVPLAPIAQALTVLARRLVTRHPGLISRLGPYVDSSFAIAPTDLPVTLLLRPHPTAMRITLHRDPPRADARIAGPLSALLGLVHGTWDGDALFFSRDLVIDGDTSAALALRNAIDDCELDLGAEIAGLSGPFGRLLMPFIDLAERRTGMPLRRAEARP